MYEVADRSPVLPRKVRSMRRWMFLAVAIAIAMTATATFGRTAAPPGPLAQAQMANLDKDFNVAMALGAPSTPAPAATATTAPAKMADMEGSATAATIQVTHPILARQAVAIDTSAAKTMKAVFYRGVTHPIKACTGAFAGIIGHDMGTTSAT